MLRGKIRVISELCGELSRKGPAGFVSLLIKIGLLTLRLGQTTVISSHDKQMREPTLACQFAISIRSTNNVRYLIMGQCDLDIAMTAYKVRCRPSLNS